MEYRLITADDIRAFLRKMRLAVVHPGRLYLVGEATQVLEGWRAYTDELVFAAEIDAADRATFDAAVQQFRFENGCQLLEEHPADLIPLPDGVAERSRIILPEKGEPHSPLECLHFDPVGVAFRYIARGDEPDYHIALYYLRNGWTNMAEMDAILAQLLPKFSMKTIAQDPAEFRRKYKGLRQMWQTILPGQTHRSQPA